MPEAENTPESKRSPLVLLANRVQAAHEQFVNTWGTSDWKTAGELKTSLRYGVIGFPIAILFGILSNLPELVNDPFFSLPLTAIATSVGVASIGALTWPMLKLYAIETKSRASRTPLT